MRHQQYLFRPYLCIILMMLLIPAFHVEAKEYLHAIEWPTPVVVQPGNHNSPPSDAIVLFDGHDLSAWENGENWEIVDGVAIVGQGDIRTKESFGDCQLHLEWSAPREVRGSGQKRGNSGVFLMTKYELQILDSYQNATYVDGQAGAIYKQTPPMVNAMRSPGQWNVYDIVFTAPRFDDDGQLLSPAYMTAFHNGLVIVNHFPLQGDTPYDRAPKYEKHADKLPIVIQDHGDPVRFRNIWIRPVNPLVGNRVHAPRFRE